MTVTENDVGEFVRDDAGREGVLQAVMRDWEDPRIPRWRRRSYDAAFIRPEMGGVEQVVPADTVMVISRLPTPVVEVLGEGSR